MIIFTFQIDILRDICHRQKKAHRLFKARGRTKFISKQIHPKILIFTQIFFNFVIFVGHFIISSCVSVPFLILCYEYIYFSSFTEFIFLNTTAKLFYNICQTVQKHAFWLNDYTQKEFSYKVRASLHFEASSVAIH